MHVRWENSVKLEYKKCNDITPDIFEQLLKYNLSRFDTKFSWIPGNYLTEDNWKKIGEFEKTVANKFDIDVEQKDTSSIPGQIGEILVYQKRKWLLFNQYIYFLFAFLNISVLYEILFYLRTAHIIYHVQKVILQSQELWVDAITQQLSSQLDPPQENDINYNMQEQKLVINEQTNQLLVSQNTLQLQITNIQSNQKQP
eukprot:TRINITY_DN13125_c0_g1_i1.p2 TRINITY_DN13125_c0_g1~~TRINITY_DN13125_c0_g1_i1.p2  ORF type:complete len:199 (-),score=26.83 TRINITY_DN13125_c0_g1_i1:115-711(-)